MIALLALILAQSPTPDGGLKELEEVFGDIQEDLNRMDREMPAPIGTLSPKPSSDNLAPRGHVRGTKGKSTVPDKRGRKRRPVPRPIKGSTSGTSA